MNASILIYFEECIRLFKYPRKCLNKLTAQSGVKLPLLMGFPGGTGYHQENDYMRNVVEECRSVQILKVTNPRLVIFRTP